MTYVPDTLCGPARLYNAHTRMINPAAIFITPPFVASLNKNRQGTANFFS
jgi:hypothetical protein